MHRIFILLLIALPFSLFSQESAETAGDSKIEWLSWNDAMEQLDKSPKKVFIDVYTDWCGWCKRMDKTTFSDPEIINLLEKYYYPVKLDAEQKEPITFDGQTFKFIPEGRRGYHQLAASLLNGKMSYPTYVILDEKSHVMQIIKGYQDENTLGAILEYIGTDKFKDIPWEEFKAGYTLE